MTPGAGATDPVDRLLGTAGRARLVLGPSVSAADASRALGTARHDTVSLTDPGLDPGAPADEDPPPALLLLVRDRLELRRVTAAIPPTWSSTRLGCVLLDGGPPPLTAGHPQWPAVLALGAASSPVCLTWVELAGPLTLAAFVADLARRTTPGALMSAGAPTLGVERDSPDLWAPGDATATVGTTAEVHDVTADHPPDAVVARSPVSPARSATEHSMLGCATDAVRVPPAVRWVEHDQDPAACARRLGSGFTGLALGGTDEQLVGPHGFVRFTDGPHSTLEPAPGAPHLLRVASADGEVVLDTRTGLRETQLPVLRPLTGVHLPWRGGDGPVELCRVVVALAQAGVPMTCEPPPAWARALLHPDLLARLEAADREELLDPLRREVHSIRTRRAAYTHHGAGAWRRQVAHLAGSPLPPPVRVSVLLPTRRPEMLAFALRQVRRQRPAGHGPELEVVLATHGHEPDRRLLDEHAASSSVPVVGVVGDAGLSFGALLNLAASRATGDVLLKMDDDDWYGPDFVSDLLMARAQSGAEITGAAPEFVYVEPFDVTVRRRDVTEAYRPVVAGGTMLVSRDTFRAVGGFRPVRRHVDAQLLRAVALAGGSVYRTHGHGYLLRRGSAGHTWDPGLGYFVSRSRTRDQWRGFRPSVLLEPDEAVGSSSGSPSGPSYGRV